MGIDDDGIHDVDNDSGLLQPAESLDDRLVGDVLDEGYSPYDRPLAINGWGLTAREAATRERLSDRLSRELPDVMVPDGDGIGDSPDAAGEPYDDEVGLARSGRLIDVAPAGEVDDFAYLYAVDVGVAGGAATAEEAAVHIVGDRDEVGY